MKARSTTEEPAPPAEPRKRPAYQWYPGDFKRDTAVQVCSFEARSLWREMLDLMHDGEPYGFLTAGGVPIQDGQLARMVGIPLKKCTAWLFELESRGVFSRTADGVIYSRRMVRDERVRNARAAGGGKSLNHPDVPQPKDHIKDGGKDTFDPSLGGSPAVAVAVATALPTTSGPVPKSKTGLPPYDQVFEEAWAAYPKRPGNSKVEAWRQWLARVGEGVDPLVMLGGVQRYAGFVIAEQTEPRYVKHAATFLGRDRHFDADWTSVASSPLTARVTQLVQEEEAALERTRLLLEKRGAA